MRETIQNANGKQFHAVSLSGGKDSTPIPNGGVFATTNIFTKSVIPNRRIFAIRVIPTNELFTTTGGFL